MTINLEYINCFSKQIEETSGEELKKVLCSGREVRVLSGKNTYFWNFCQKGLNHDFDAIYARGIEKFVITSSNKVKSLINRISPKIPLSEMAKKMLKASAIGVGGFAGWLVGLVYTVSMSNLILHEYGHAWAVNQLQTGANPIVNAVAKFWLEKGNWTNWFWGVRQGALGNWTGTTNPRAPLTDFGKSLTSDQRELFIFSAGIGAELVLNLTIAGLGLLALRKKQRVLGASLLGFALISHSAAHSYIRRSPELLSVWVGKPGGDPPLIARYLAKLLGCSNVEAFRLLWYGYLFFPLALLGLLIALFIKSPEEVPDESVLMRLLLEKNPPFAFRKILAEVEIEMSSEIEKMDEKNSGELVWKICDRLISKIKNQSEMRTIFEKTRSQISKELKGRVGHYVTFSFRLRMVAAIAAFVAYQLRDVSQHLIPALAPAFYYLTGIFIIAQGVSLLLDFIQTGLDLCNEKLSILAKTISISKLVLSIATFAFITAALFTPGLNGMILSVLIITALIRLILFCIQLIEIRMLSARVAKRAPLA